MAPATRAKGRFVVRAESVASDYTGLDDSHRTRRKVVGHLASLRRTLFEAWSASLRHRADEVASVTELAERLNVDRSYVSRILRLNLLAPDIVEAIFAGREPSGLSLAKLTPTIPVLWHERSGRCSSSHRREPHVNAEFSPVRASPIRLERSNNFSSSVTFEQSDG